MRNTPEVKVRVQEIGFEDDDNEMREKSLEDLVYEKLSASYHIHGKIEGLEEEARKIKGCVAKLITVLAGTQALEAHEIADMLGLSNLEYSPEPLDDANLKKE